LCLSGGVVIPSLREAKIFGVVTYAFGVGVVVIVSLREAKIFAVVVRAC
jgi:hypothetical protein